MMLLYFAAFLAFVIGLIHSVLGERAVIQRLARAEGLPRLKLGGREVMLPILRFAWHITSIAWFGFAGILVLMARDQLTNASAGVVIGATFVVSAAVTGFASRGRHLAWIVFLAIGAIALSVAV